MPNLHLKNGTWDSPSKIYVRSGGEWKQVGNVHTKSSGSWNLVKTIAPDPPSWVDIATDQPTAYTSPTLKWNKPTTGGAVTGYRIIPRRHDSAGTAVQTYTTINISDGDTTSYGPWNCAQDTRYSWEIVALGKNGTESSPVTYNILTGHPAVVKTGNNYGWVVNNSWRYPTGSWTAASHNGSGSPNNALTSSTSSEWVNSPGANFTGTNAYDYQPKNNGVDPFYAGLSGANAHGLWPWIVLYPVSGRQRVRYVWLDYIASRGRFDWTFPAAFSRQSRGSAQYDLVYARDAAYGGWIQVGGTSLVYVANQYATGQAYDAGSTSWQCTSAIDTQYGHPLIRQQSYSLDQLGSNLTSLRTRASIRRIQMIWDTWGVTSTYNYNDPEQQNNGTW